MNGGTVGLVEAAFEDVRNAQLSRYPHVLLGSTQGEVSGFKHIDAAEQHERVVIADMDSGIDRNSSHSGS